MLIPHIKMVSLSNPSKGPPGDTVVNVDLYNFDVGAQGQVGLHNLLLGFQRVATAAIILY